MTITADWIRENYNKFNKLYWNGKLPDNLSFFVSNDKKNIGDSYYTCSHLTQIVTPTKILISNYYHLNEYEYKNILLHEMIHIYDYITNPIMFNDYNRDKYNHHGTFFFNELNRLNKFGWNVVITKKIQITNN